MRPVFLLSVIAWVLAATLSNASAERRVALVIGNSAYTELQPLTNPVADAADMADALEAMGYDVIRAENLTKDGFRSATQDFLGKIADAEAALLFYAGHAVQVESVNYLLPVDAVLAQPSDVLFDAIPLQDIVGLMERRARVSVVLVDACRDNPLGQVALRNGPRGLALEQGLAAENASDGSYLAFAAQPGKPSFDGDGRNSPFTKALLDHITVPGVDIRLAMADVRESVAEATGYRQIPWESSSLVGRFSLYPEASAPSLVILPAGQVDEQPPEDSPAPAEDTASAAPAEAPAPAADAPAEPADAQVAAAEPQAADPPPPPVQPEAAPDVAVEPDPAPMPAPSAPAPAVPDAAAQTPQPPAAPATGEPVEQAALAPATGEAAAADPAAPVDPAALPLLVQAELIRIGCLSGTADGIWGPQSRSALREWTRRREVKVDREEPTADALQILRAERGRICPAVADSTPARTTAAPARSSRSAPARAARPERKQKSGGGRKGYFGWQKGGGGVQFCTTCPDS